RGRRPSGRGYDAALRRVPRSECQQPRETHEPVARESLRLRRILCAVRRTWHSPGRSEDTFLLPRLGGRLLPLLCLGRERRNPAVGRVDHHPRLCAVLSVAICHLPPVVRRLSWPEEVVDRPLRRLALDRAQFLGADLIELLA